MAATDDTRTAPRPSKNDAPRDEAARAARKRRLYAGILAGFVHDMTAAARGPRPATQPER
jgi:hypothetical protein